MEPRSFVEGVVSKARYLRIVEDISTLTHGENRIHQYILRHFVSICFQSIEQVAVGCGVSKSSIGRYLNKLGFTGYNHFKRSITDGNYDNVYLEKIKKISNTTISGYMHEVVDEYTEYLKVFCEQIKQDLKDIDLDNITDVILNANTVYVAGASVSGIAASLFSTISSYVRNNIILLPLDPNELTKKLTTVTDRDVLILFSYWPHNKLIVRISEYFKIKNATVIVLTNKESTPFSAYSDYLIPLPNEERGIFKSRVKLFLFCEIVSTLLFFKTGGETQIPEIEELTIFFDVFFDEKKRNSR